MPISKSKAQLIALKLHQLATNCHELIMSTYVQLMDLDFFRNQVIAQIGHPITGLGQTQPGML